MKDTDIKFTLKELAECVANIAGHQSAILTLLGVGSPDSLNPDRKALQEKVNDVARRTRRLSDILKKQ
jgi:hypothetical protein